MNSLTAKFYQLNAPGDLVLAEQELAVDGLKPDEYLAETIYSAISPGTETAAFSGAEPLRPGKVYPRLMGYCNVARVIAAGEEANGLHAGDHILTFQSHRSHFVQNSRQFALKLPAGTDLKQASTAYLFHLGLHALQSAQVQYGHQIGIIGQGTLGMTTALMAKSAGANVFVFSNQAPAGQLSKNGIHFFPNRARTLASR
jgi:2-desacetyl-2-hydroxyethyl bacteriochlorophyllide A dehydrogenase